MRRGNEFVFISYRRTQSSQAASWLATQLTRRFGDGSVFLDVESTQAGSLFPDELRFALERSLALLALVGPGWVNELVQRAAKAGETDYVAEELRIARQLGIPILPVLVGGARMPAAHELPAELAFFASTHALNLSAASESRELDTIVAAVARLGGLVPRRTGATFARWRDRLRAALRSPLELTLRPRRYLLRSLRGHESDLLVLTGWSWLALALTLPAYAMGFGVPLGSLTVAMLALMLLGAPLLVIVTTLPLAGLSALALRLLRGRGSFKRMFSVICMMRICVWIWFVGGVSVLLFIAGDADPSVAAWKGAIWRADSVDAVLGAAREFPDYAGPGIWRATQAALLAMLVAFATWAHLAYRAITATHGVGTFARWVLLALFLAAEVGGAVLLLAE